MAQVQFQPLEVAVKPVAVSRASRLRYILQYYRKSQLAMRLVALGRHHWMRLSGGGLWAGRDAPAPALRDNVAMAGLLEWKLASRRAGGSAEQARRILQGHYRFLNHELRLPDPLDWLLRENSHAPRLWRFYLHFHEFLLDLAAEASDDCGPQCLSRARELMVGWLSQSRLDDPRTLSDAWHPYCISRRLPVWILLATGFPGTFDSETILVGIAAQARFLERHLEWDVRGNHLMENLKALAMAGAMFKGGEAQRWLDKSRRLLRKELKEQILPSGEHFERSPMYHALVLESLLDMRDATETACPELASLCSQAAMPMARFLREVIHPDGDLPLLGDSSLAEAPRPRRLLARAELHDGPPQPSQFSETSRARLAGAYWTFRDQEDYVILDAGPVGPDHLPAHAHSDLLTWEASLGGRRFVVDSGVFHYQDDAMRQYCRSTAAHNVLQIDDRPLCDTWSSFRMGYRGWPSDPETGETVDFAWVRARHNACRRSGAVSVGRFLACRPGGPWLCVDWAEGTGVHRLTNWLHFHPDAEVEMIDTDHVRIEWHGRTVTLRWLASGELALLGGWYCPRFGVRHRNPVLRWTAEVPLPAVCGYSLAWRDAQGEATLDVSGPTPVVDWIEESGRVQLWPVNKPLPVAGPTWRRRRQPRDINP
ncbi:MAG: alginate lyase family protein [Planctomycetes bacterium]|nr:alginate lyase family protein [Planctomycetota bacterium]